MMNPDKHSHKWWAWLAAVLMVGFVSGYVARERFDSRERLFNQSVTLTKITRDAMIYRATPERIAKRVETEMNTSVIFSPGTAQEAYRVVLPAESGPLGMGGRWIINLQTGKDGRCDKAWLETQPTDYL